MGKLKKESKTKSIISNSNNNNAVKKVVFNEDANEKFLFIKDSNIVNKNTSLERENNRNDDEKGDEQVKKRKILNKIRFKKSKNESNSTLTKLKKGISANKEKFNAIKNNVLNQIKLADSINQGTAKTDQENKPNDLNFIKRVPRLTNSFIKSLIKKDKKETVDTESTLPTSILKGVNDKLCKKTKSKLKKQVWHSKIDLIKTQLKDNKDRIKREKTVIVGDVKPMVDSLSVSKEAEVPQLIPNTNTHSKNEIIQAPRDNLSKKEQKEKNHEREQSKSILKQSIRFKKAQEDLSLFNQLLDYSEFTKNPLDLLKKHLSA